MDEPLPDETLPLAPLTSLLPLGEPFTPASAREAGLDRAGLDRLLRAGLVRRVLRGVHVRSTVPDSTALRRAATRLVVPSGAVVVGRTAAWLHGVDVTLLPPHAPRPLETVRPRRGRPGPPQRASGRDVEDLDGLRVTTPLRTALDLGRTLPRHLALAAMDGLMAVGGFGHADLLSELPRLARRPGAAGVRELVALVDARAGDVAESVLRLRWHDARLPTAVPAMPVAAGGRLVRLALGVERCRFGAVLAGRVVAADLVALQGAGWHVVVLGEGRVLTADPEALAHHLEREFHQHLLADHG